LVNSRNKCLVSRPPESYVQEDNHHSALDTEYQFPKTFLKSLSPATHYHEFNFRKSNFHLLYASLCEIYWSFLSQYFDTEEAVSSFYSMLYEIFELYVPKKDLLDLTLFGLMGKLYMG
jgi:hypothetical protein